MELYAYFGNRRNIKSLRLKWSDSARIRGAMFGSRQQGMVIAKGLKIVGSVTAEGLLGFMVA